MGVLENAYIRAFPEKKYKVRSDYYHNVSWFNDELRAMRDHLNFLGELSSHYGIARVEFNNFRTLYRNAVAQEKIRFNDNFIRNSSNPAKAMWQIINKHRGKNVSCNENTTITPDEFNNFFSNIAHSVLANIPDSSMDPLGYLPDFETPVFGSREVTFNEVRDVIGDLKNKTSRDIYGMNVKLIKTATNCILLPLTRLINLCLRNGVFPDGLKIAIVRPILKKGDPSTPNNYRPISLLPVISKVLEKCIAIQIIEHFEKNNLFTKHQWGFRKNRNTVQGILDLVAGIVHLTGRSTAQLFFAI